MQQIKKILVPVDFSEGSKAAFQYAIYMAEQLEASIEVLFVWQRPFYLGPQLIVSTTLSENQVTVEELAKKQAQGELEKFISSEKTTVPIRSRLMEGIIDKEIIQVAKDESTDLIVLGAHGESGRRHLILGSVAKRVVRSAPCPVCVFNSSEKEKN